MARAKGKKAHRERVAKRNRKIQDEKKLQNKRMEEYIRQIQAMQAAQNENNTSDAVNDAVNDTVNDAVVIEDVEVIDENTEQDESTNI